MAGSVVLTPTNVPVVPGTTGTCSVRIRNTGVVVDQFSISVLGQPAAWTTAVPAVLSLFPGAEGTIELHFAPPRTAEVGSGPTPFGVRVDASQDPEGSVVEEGEVDLLAYTDLRAKITPRTSEAKRKARHEVLLDNRGNTAVEADLSASDPDEVLAFELSPRTVTVPAGGTSRVAVNVAAREGFLKGPDKQRPFQVRVLAGDQPAVNLDATLLQKAGMPRFILPLAAAAVAAVLLAVMLPALKKDPASGKLNLASEDAATTTTAAPAAAPAGEEPADPNAPATAEEAAAAAEAEKAANGKDPGSTAGGAASPSGAGGTTAAAADDPTTGGAGTPAAGPSEESSAVTSPTATTAAPPPTVTTTTQPGATTTAPPAYAKFIGTWKNTNASTGFEPQTVIRNDATSIYVRGYGACSPSYCDWGEGKTTLADGGDNEILVAISTSTGVVKQRITYVSGQLKIHSDKYRTDGTFWYSADETFNKA